MIVVTSIREIRSIMYSICHKYLNKEKNFLVFASSKQEDYIRRTFSFCQQSEEFIFLIRF